MYTWKRLLLGTIIILLSVLLISLLLERAYATQIYLKVICHHNPANQVTLTFHTPQAYAGHLGQPHSGQTYDTNGACVEPSVTPTVMPTSIPTPTKVQECDWDECQEVTPTVIPTPTEEVTPTPTDAPHESSSVASGNTSVSTPGDTVCTVVIDAPILQGFEKTSKTSVFWHWWASKSQVSKQWIEYGYSKGNYPYSVFVPTNVTGYEIGSLQPGVVRWARIGVMNEQGCVAYSEPLDP